MKIRQLLMICLLLSHTIMALGQKQNPNEKLEYLIGTWKLNVEGYNIVAYMDFEWGPNKTYVFSRNRNSRNNGPAQIENSAMISWDGVAETFVISSVYNGEGDLLVGRGTVDVTDKAISRDILLHYAEGEGIPFVNRVAQKGGGTLRYRQRWEIVDKDSFIGRMDVLMDDGQWKTTFSNEKWRKQK